MAKDVTGRDDYIIRRALAVGAISWRNASAVRADRCEMPAWPAYGLLLLLLTACQSLPPGAQACRVERAAVLPVRLDHGILLVPGALNGQPVQLVVDTGAEGSLVSSEAVARFGLERDTTRRTTINSVGGQITMANAWVRSFIVGNLETPQVSLAVGPLPALGEPASPLAGLVGADYLAAFDIEFDLPRQRMALYRLVDCGPGFSPWSDPAMVLPLRRFRRGLLLLDVQIDRQPVVALIDSGARLSSIRTEVAERLGVGPAALARDPLTAGSGVDLIAMAGCLHRFAAVRIGSEVLRDQEIEVAPLALPGADMLLGADYLRTRHVWLSYSTQRLFLAPAR